jgi:hypothetical protein
MFVDIKLAEGDIERMVASIEVDARDIERMVASIERMFVTGRGCKGTSR